MGYDHLIVMYWQWLQKKPGIRGFGNNQQSGVFEKCLRMGPTPKMTIEWEIS